MRLSIEVTPEQHHRLKAGASLQGKSIKDYVLERIFPENLTGDEADALKELEAFLMPRIQAASSENQQNVSVKQLFESAHQSDV
jgi:hypothetical protein